MKNTSHEIAVDVGKASRMSSIGRTTLFKHITSGDLPSIMLGGKRLIRVDTLDQWLKERESANQSHTPSS